MRIYKYVSVLHRNDQRSQGLGHPAPAGELEPSSQPAHRRTVIDTLDSNTVSDSARVLVSGLHLDVEVGQPSVAGVAERDAATGGSPRVLLGEELREQLLRLALRGRRPGQLDALTRHRIDTDVHADPVDLTPLADAAASSLALVRGQGAEGSSWTGSGQRLEIRSNWISWRILRVPSLLVRGSLKDREPPWGVEPQTYALRVDLQVSTPLAIGDFIGLIHSFGRSRGRAILTFVDSFVDTPMSWSRYVLFKILHRSNAA